MFCKPIVTIPLVTLVFLVANDDALYGQIIRVGGFVGNTSTIPEDVSDTGIVVGSAPNPNRSSPFFWSVANGFSGWGSVEGFAKSISADGASIVGIQNTQFSPPRSAGFVSQGPRFPTSFGRLPGPNSTANYALAGVSDSSNIIVGSISDPDEDYFGIARWDSSEQTYETLGVLAENFSTQANEVSGDGSTIVGTGSSGFGSFAIRHTDEVGVQSLGDLEDGIGIGRAYAVSFDGSVIVGQVNVEGNLPRAFRWTEETGMTNLGLLENGEHAFANGITNDGEVIVGTASSNGRTQGFIWNADDGMRSIEEFLVTENVVSDLGGWSLTTIDAISANGRFIAGRGNNPDGGFGAYFVDLQATAVPEPSGVIVVLVLWAFALLKRQRASTFHRLSS